MEESILSGTKKALGLLPDYVEFDPELIMFINSQFSTLHQIGLGPVDGFSIEDAVPTWDSFTLGDKRLNSVKQYVYLKVKLAFDPPQQGAHLESLKEMAKEFEWRLNVVREGDVYGQPSVENEVILDGGAP